MLSDIEIAQQAKSRPMKEIAQKIGIKEEDLIPYGWNKAKVNLNAYHPEAKKGKLILVTAITPTSSGEGKTTTSIGLADGLSLLGKKTALALREPSLGPVFGMKGGAAGGGYSQVIPMEDINLHFTGDIHAIESANNLIAAMLDNAIYQKTTSLDPRRVTWRRAMDMNDRQLRQLIDGFGKVTNGVPREDGFDITTASEVMALFCLATSISDLKERLGRVVVGYSYENEPVRVSDLHAQGAAAALLKDALAPNLVQTLEGTPAFIHGGPFANIAHGCNSIIATQMALTHADYTVTEAGFGADLGAEKFLDIKARQADLDPDAVVIVATVRALKLHGGVDKKDLQKENVPALKVGMSNLIHHVRVIRDVYGLNAVVAINRFDTDTDEEIKAIQEAMAQEDIEAVEATHFVNGGKGAIDLAKAVLKATEKEQDFRFAYDVNDSIEEKLLALVQKVYGGKEVSYSSKAKKQMKMLAKWGYDKLPICVAKTQYSLSDDPKALNEPKDFTLHVEEMTVSAGAGFIVVMTGNILKMPGLPKVPAANQIDVDRNGVISGLF